ncbi:hypothetical protein NHQ30_009963 [Ciborinia camelliae]|nr:hypothetical protein NHQ30_009963 [Ciborinia camelliae]
MVSEISQSGVQSTPLNIPADGYQIPDIIFRDPQNRRLKVLTIGAGISGIMMAYQIQKQCQKYASKSGDIWKYLDKVCGTFDLRKYMTFNTEVIGCLWDEETGKWTVKMKQTSESGEKVFEETCDLLLHATGILNKFKFPDIKGIEKFKGKVIHTARWPNDYQEEQWKNESVAILGSGASSIQTLPSMQPHVKHIDVYVRTAIWFISIGGNDGSGKEYTPEEREKFRNDLPALVEHAKYLEDSISDIWGMFFKDSEAQKAAQKKFAARMAEFIKDKRLLKGFTPNFGIGCRRITPGDPYMRAIQEPNVDVHFSAVEEITEDSVIDSEGRSRKVDTIICATGFDVSFIPRFPIVGQNSVDLREKWKKLPESYLGVTVPDIPNFITFIGPTWPVENGSIMGPLSEVSNYAIKFIKKMQNEFIKSIAPKQDMTDLFNAHTQELIKQTVWGSSCRSWYKSMDSLTSLI